jgi:hypothetical protein
VVVAACATLAVGAGSRVPWTASPADRALLRLSWRAQSETTEECRPLTEEEMAELPVHMRAPQVCESRPVPYFLRVSIDGRPALDDTLHGAGAREDRPVYVYREIALRPGRHALHVEFTPLAGDERARDQAEARERDEEEVEEEDEDDEDDERGSRSVRLIYSTTLLLGERDVVLIAYDPDRHALVRLTGR